MAGDEMRSVREPDIALLKEHHDRIYYYFAQHDGWVGDQREALLAALSGEDPFVRVVHGHRDIPHAFCISK